MHLRAIHREVRSRYQADLNAAIDDRFKQIAEQTRFLKTAVPVLGESRVVRHFLIKLKSSEPSIREVHPHLFHQAPLASDAVQVSDQQNPEEQLRIDRRPAGVAIVLAESIPNTAEIDVRIDQPQLVIFRYVILQPEVVEQRLRSSVMTHHDELRPSQCEREKKHYREGVPNNIKVTRICCKLAFPKEFFNSITCFPNTWAVAEMG